MGENKPWLVGSYTSSCSTTPGHKKVFSEQESLEEGEA